MTLRPLTLALLLALPIPAFAQDTMMLEFSLNDLDDATNSTVLRAAGAACILGAGDAEVTATYFTNAGWSRSDETDMGIVTLSPPAGDAIVTLYEGGRICEVASEVWGFATAMGSLQILSSMAALGTDFDYDQECTTILLTDTVTATITSTGQDPICMSETNSSIRYTVN
jgi:hypothetical protein